MKFNIERLTEIMELTRHLAVGLKDLAFTDNFISFEVSVTIPATSELQITNQLNNIPTKYIITDQVGNGLITRGDSTWTRDFIYLQNNGSVDVTIDVTFMEK